MIKNDFPIFANNPGIVYLDSAATVQKPSVVIDGLKEYLENDYANIHRGAYELSERSEELFWEGRKAVSEWMQAEPEEIIFTGNSTDASNLLTQSLVLSGMLREGDIIMIGEGEHHANIVPWQMAAERVGCTIVWIPLLEDGSINVDRLAQNADSTVRVVAVTAISNVTGTINDLFLIKATLSESTLFVVDASQAIAHIPVLPHEIGCDFCRWTGHKIGALPGIGVLRGKKEHLKTMTPSRGGGGSIASVTKEGYGLLGSPDKFEPGTPNLTGVISLHLVLYYLSNTSAEKGMTPYGMIEELEKPLVQYCLKKFEKLKKYGVTLLGSEDADSRVGVFSFLLPEGIVSQGLGRKLAAHNICIRCGGQCAHPYHESLGKVGSCRMSLWIYNDKEDCKEFFKKLSEIIG